jgi:4-hydroxy-4-methyl-2-oxoglutarate aldolase
MTEAKIIEALRHSSVASVSDALDEITGQRGFMRPDMRPLFKTNLAGPAATCLLRPALRRHAASAPDRQLQLLDEAAPGSVLVYVLEDGLEVAGIGELMALTAKTRGLAGAVIDGGARDIEEIMRLEFPVFCRSISPASIVGRHVAVALQVPVTCAGIQVRPADYVLGDMDGVVIVPRDQASAVVALAREFDAKEVDMREMIRATQSLRKTLEKYGRS